MIIIKASIDHYHDCGIVKRDKFGHKRFVMKASLSREEREVVEAIHYRPAISIVLPFEPKMSLKSELKQLLKIAIDKVEHEVRENYRDELADIVIQKLRKIVSELNFNTYKKSIAIYVSPVFEKVLYLDIPVEEKIMVDGSFEIRDLLLAKKELHRYMVAVLSSKWSKVYVGNYSSFTKVVSHVPDHIAAFTNEVPERVSNFSDPSHRREVLLEKFLRHTDDGLRFLLQAYPLPLFVMGTKRVLGHFKAITKNDKAIVGYVHGNYEDASESELSKVMNPYIEDWKKIKQDDIRHQIEKAADAEKLSAGMKEVWKNAFQRKGRLLVVEKDFTYVAEQGADKDVINRAEIPYSKFSYIKDAVDEVIERVLEHGGDVEFVDKNMLREFGHIAMVQYY